MSPADFRLIVYARDRWSEACPTLRVIGPAGAAGLEVIPGYDWDTGSIHIQPALVDSANAVVICRDFPRYSKECQEIITRAHHKGIPLVYETDDILFDMPLEHPDFLHYQAAASMILSTILEADRVVTSTAYLKEKLAPYHPDVQVIPNLLDDGLWKIQPLAATETSSSPVVIGYFGTHTHRRDMEMIQSALAQTLDRFGEQVLLKIWGDCLPSKLAAHPRVESVSTGIFDYSRFAEHIQQQRVDLWIAPLLDTPFNRAKSAIKFLEYSATATPGVYSRIDPYEAVIQDGENGFLAAGDAEWIDRLGQLVQNAALRHQMGSRALETVRANWLLSKNHSLFSHVYRSATCRAPGMERYTSPQIAAVLHTLASGSRQMIDRLDQLSYLDRVLSENRIEGAPEEVSATDLFNMLRNAQQYGSARDAELTAVRSSTTYRLAGVFGRAAGLASQLLQRARGIISDPSQKGPAK